MTDRLDCGWRTEGGDLLFARVGAITDPSDLSACAACEARISEHRIAGRGAGIFGPVRFEDSARAWAGHALAVILALEAAAARATGEA